MPHMWAPRCEPTTSTSTWSARSTARSRRRWNSCRWSNGKACYRKYAIRASPSYFEQVAQIIPILLITLGIKFGFFRATLREPTQRAATATTVTLMSIGLVCALSTLPWGDDECGQMLEAWHEYPAFVVSLRAIFTGLASLVWLLVVNVPDEEGTKAES
jgi:hypothetical protein